LAKDPSVLVFTETTSNLHHDSFFPSIDKLIAPLNTEEFKDLQPDLLLTFGGMVVSKKVKVFLRAHKPITHWHVDQKKANDTFFSLTSHLRGTPNKFLSQLLPKAILTSNGYQETWKDVMQKRREKHGTYLQGIPFCDFKAFNALLQSVPNNTVLQLGNSSTIRYTQLFDVNPTLEVYCNRGTSGIEGSTSTAVGSAVASAKQTVFMTGDLSFLYDSNALWNDHIPNNFRIIVINNSGGGIFRILPGPKDTKNFDTYFETKHQLDASMLCEMYHFKYMKAVDEVSLNQALNTFYDSSHTPKLLEVFTPSKVNDAILLEYFKVI
jgi:2-succinyl-5-enolpyruvyl-6-hydroxy-3-cyclohexene-1-carboxylate synthase